MILTYWTCAWRRLMLKQVCFDNVSGFWTLTLILKRYLCNMTYTLGSLCYWLFQGGGPCAVLILCGFVVYTTGRLMFVFVTFCHFPLPLGVGGWLRFMIVAIPGLFNWLFWAQPLSKGCSWQCIILFVIILCWAILWVKQWAATWQNQHNVCAPSEDSDQPWHPPSLIRVFAVRSMSRWGPKVSSDQTKRMPRLISVFTGRTHILLVLSCRGSLMITVIPYGKSIGISICGGYQASRTYCQVSFLHWFFI